MISFKYLVLFMISISAWCDPIIKGDEVLKIVHTNNVHSISHSITDSECQKIIPDNYQIALKKGSTEIKDIYISRYLTLHNNHELIPHSENLTGGSAAVFTFKATLKRPTTEQTQVISGVSFIKKLPNKGIEGVFVIDGMCQAHITRRE